MRIFNIGIREVLLLLLIMLILFGPNQMRQNARKLAQTIRRFDRSNTWRTFIGLYDDVNAIKDEVIRESGIREVQDSLRGVSRQLYDIESELNRSNWKDSSAAAQDIPEKTETAPEATDAHESESDRL